MAIPCILVILGDHGRSLSEPLHVNIVRQDKGDEFDKALADFSIAHADQNEKDHDALTRAIRDGKVEAVFEEAK